jgi:hypothetical protein
LRNSEMKRALMKIWQRKVALHTFWLAEKPCDIYSLSDQTVM